MSQQPRIRVVVQLPYNRPDHPLPNPPSVSMCSRGSLTFDQIHTDRMERGEG